jgi:electron transfer flavoprotein beta subunit
MNIYVCVKNVADTAESIALTGTAEYDESVKFVINPYDEYGLEAALQIVETQGEGEVITVTVGKEAATRIIRTALAIGAHRGILVKTDEQFLDSSLTALAIKKAIELDGSPDLIFTGKESVDSEGLQTPYRLAAAFGMPVVNDVSDLRITDGRAIVEREIEGGARDVINLSMPCVIGGTKGMNEPRQPTLPAILRAKKKEIKQINIQEFDLDLESAKTTLLKLEPVPERSKANLRMIEGDPQAMAEAVAQLLVEEKVLNGLGD